MIKDLRKLKDDEDVKAVVLRVNSPGGSAYGSEQIWYAVSELKKEKPVIVSMGDYAAQEVTTFLVMQTPSWPSLPH